MVGLQDLQQNDFLKPQVNRNSESGGVYRNELLQVEWDKAPKEVIAQQQYFKIYFVNITQSERQDKSKTNIHSQEPCICFSQDRPA